MNWKPHTTLPEKSPESALVCTKDDDGSPLLLGIYIFRNKHFQDEMTGHMPAPPFWWIYESELFAEPLPD